MRPPLAIVRCLVASCALVACAPPVTSPPPTPPPPPADVDSGAAVLSIGAPASAGALLPFGDGQEVELVAGAQGGFHVWLGYALRDLPAGVYVVERRATRVSDGAVVLRYRGAVEVGPAGGDGWWSAPAPIPMFMCPTPIGLSVVGEPIALELRVLDEEGATEHAHAGATVVPRCPEAQQEFCVRICSG